MAENILQITAYLFLLLFTANHSGHSSPFHILLNAWIHSTVFKFQVYLPTHATYSNCTLISQLTAL